MARTFRIAGLTVLPLGLLGLSTWAADQHPERASFALAPKPATSIVARGRIEPRTGVIAISGPPESMSTVAIVDKILVEQGSTVEPGQVVAVINGYELAQADYEVAKANLRVAQLQRDQLLAGVGKVAEIDAQRNALAARRAQLLKAEKDLSRASMLVEKNAVSIQLLDAQKATFDQLTQEVAQGQNTIKALSEVRPVDDALATGQVAVAEANVTRAKKAMERLRIRARQSGTVLSIQTHSGEMISGDGIMRVGDLAHLVVVAEVDQGGIGGIRPGMSATVSLSSLAEPVAGKVSRIAHETYRQRRPSSDILVGRDAKIVEVEVTPDRPLPEVIGAEVTVRFDASPAT
ncbi:efflux RND transporter periplasmic adaptor subunit [Methylobacterium sp. E-016]|nr:efflux RND transporter periplasmic adaptor subunit [Methylobacterium sp. E-016]